MNQEGLVFVLAKNLLDESTAGVAFLAKDAALASAGIDQQTERERLFRLLREVFDDLVVTVFLENEIIFHQVAE